MRAVVLAGGRGSRMGGLTAQVPKPMLPVGRWPLAGHQLRRLADAGVREAVLAAGYRAEALAPLVDLAAGWGTALRIAVEPEPAGTAGGLRHALQTMDADPDETVLVANGDLLSGHDLTAQMDAGRLAPALVHVRRVPDARGYGLVECAPDGRVSAFREKPAAPGPGLVNAGTYVLRVGEVLHRPGASSLEREVFPQLAAAGLLRAHHEEAATHFRDVGTPQALLAASVDAVSGRLPWHPAALPALVDPAARVAPDARLEGGTAVHAGAVVGAGARLAGVLVLPGATVPAGARLSGEVVAP